MPGRWYCRSRRARRGRAAAACSVHGQWHGTAVRWDRTWRANATATGRVGHDQNACSTRTTPSPLGIHTPPQAYGTATRRALPLCAAFCARRERRDMGALADGDRVPTQPTGTATFTCYYAYHGFCVILPLPFHYFLYPLRARHAGLVPVLSIDMVAWLSSSRSPHDTSTTEHRRAVIT